jgi:hypothetical protein
MSNSSSSSFVKTIVIFIIFFSRSATPLPSCYLFPKVFGGLNDDSFFKSFDVNYAKDLIVAGGDTKDWDLHQQGTASIPIIIAYSATNSSILWGVSLI